MTRVRQLLIGTGIALALLFTGNLLYLDYKLFFEEKKEEMVEIPTSSEREERVQLPSSPSAGLTRAQVEAIVREATRSLKPQAPEKAPTTTTQTTQTSAVKEFFVHLGSGSSTAQDWEDVPGAEAYIDSTKYGRIKNVYFEASLHTPTGNQTAYVRLYNVTDKNVVWPTELSIEGGEPKLLISPSLTLPSGNKLYRVQMKTQLKSTTNLIQARVRIITE